MYVCSELELRNNEYICKVWTEYAPSFWDQFATLTLPEVTLIWISVTSLFATAYSFKHLPFFIRRR